MMENINIIQILTSSSPEKFLFINVMPWANWFLLTDWLADWLIDWLMDWWRVKTDDPLLRSIWKFSCCGVYSCGLETSPTLLFSLCSHLSLPESESVSVQLFVCDYLGCVRVIASVWPSMCVIASVWPSMCVIVSLWVRVRLRPSRMWIMSIYLTQDRQ